MLIFTLNKIEPMLFPRYLLEIVRRGILIEALKKRVHKLNHMTKFLYFPV